MAAYAALHPQSTSGCASNAQDSDSLAPSCERLSYSKSIVLKSVAPGRTHQDLQRGQVARKGLHELCGYAGRGEQLNAVEIEEAISQLANLPFDPKNFPFYLPRSFRQQGDDDQEAARHRLQQVGPWRSSSDQQHSHRHMRHGTIAKTLKALKESPATAKAKAKFILATNGVDFEAEDLASGENAACAYKDFPDHFGFATVSFQRPRGMNAGSSVQLSLI